MRLCIGIRGRIVTDRNATHEKRTRVGRGLDSPIIEKKMKNLEN